MESQRPDFCALTDLASTAIGGQVVFASDEWFAPAIMFLNPEPPVFKEELFTEYGKWMDGWETRRKRVPGHDWCLLKLGVPGTVYGFEVDTAFFTGNNVPAISILGANLPDGPGLPDDVLDSATGVVSNTGMMGTAATPEQIQKVEKALSGHAWQPLLEKSPLRPGYPDTRIHFFAASSPRPVTHLRVNYFPDGGVARLRVYGEVSAPLRLNPSARMDFAAALNGGAALCCSNQHYGTPANTLLPGRAPNMGNGWETARNPQRPAVLELGKAGQIDFSYSKDWFVMRLGSRCNIDNIEVDTNHFKGNFPESTLIEVCDLPEVWALPVLEQRRLFFDNAYRQKLSWKPLLKRTKMLPHAQQYFSGGDPKAPLENAGAATHALVTIFPDGGISRLRMHGAAAPATNSKL
jgi:allantoicase